MTEQEPSSNPQEREIKPKRDLGSAEYVAYLFQLAAEQGVEAFVDELTTDPDNIFRDYRKPKERSSSNRQQQPLHDTEPDHELPRRDQDS